MQARLAGKKGLGDKLGFFPFPAVDGGKGAVTEAFGGGGGFAVGKDAPPRPPRLPEVPRSDVDDQRRGRRDRRRCCRWSRARRTPSPTRTSRSSRETLAAATGFQLYLDQAYPPAVGQQVNDSVAELIAGSKTPEQVVEAITEAAKTE